MSALNVRFTSDDWYYYATSELGYPSGTSSLFAINEVLGWMSEWLEIVQQELELELGTSTVAISSATFSNATLGTDVLRVDSFWYTPGGTSTSTYRLSPRDPGDLQVLQNSWTYDAPDTNPQVVYPILQGTWGLWPAPQGTGTLITEYLKSYPGFAQTVTAFPPWCRTGVRHYVGYRFFSKYGPAYDPGRASMYLKLHQMNLGVWKSYKLRAWPSQGARLVPAGQAQAQILAPRRRR